MDRTTPLPLYDFFETRRTVRRYSNRHVDEALISRLLTAACHAPTTGNMQLYSIVITRDDAARERLAPAHFNQPSVTSGAGIVLTFCADFNRFEKWCRQRQASPGFENLQSTMSAILDTVIVAQQFCTLAEMSGLGCCYLGTTTYNAADISRELKLPRRVIPVTTLTVGYPDGPAPLSDRLPVSAIIHSEVYHDYSNDDIDKAYAEKEARPDSAKFIAENGKTTLAQVFTDVRYPRSTNEAFSETFMQILRDNGCI
ncbi:MAG: nitroreductase family protein [Muribaculaceae bacterium]